MYQPPISINLQAKKGLNMLKYLSFLYPFYISFFLLTIGCSRPILKMPEPLPPIVKKYNSTKVYGHKSGMQNTGIYLRKGDIYSLFGTGKITRRPQSNDFLVPGSFTIGRIGNNSYFHLNVMDFYGYPQTASNSGKLYLGIPDGSMDEAGNALQPEYFKDNSGYFRVDIIVWQQWDWDQFVDFLEKLKLQDPDNEHIKSALSYNLWHKEFYFAKAKTTEEVEKIEKELEELKEEPVEAKEETKKSAPESETLPLATTSEAALEKKERVAQLEEKLSQLTATLAQLEEGRDERKVG
jgi:hypothetical protein